MLLTMKSMCEAMRGLAYTEAVTMDLAHRGAQEDRPLQQSRIDLMIPVIKGWLSEVAQEVTSLGLQVHGGMGFVEETGAAQYLRDVRITPIYEGTNGIQAADLVSRKLGRDGGATMEAMMTEVNATITRLQAAGDARLTGIAESLTRAMADQENATRIVLAELKEDPNVALGASFEYMMQTGYLFGGWHLGRSALVAFERLKSGSDNPFYEAKIATAQYYGEQILPRCAAHAGAVAGARGALQSFQQEWI